MQIPPSAKEVKTAVTKKGCEAIPFLDLRDLGKAAYRKQLDVCKNFLSDKLTTANEIEAARLRAKNCREQRIQVRTVFERAIKRTKTVLQAMKYGDPLKPDLTTILRELESSKKGHETAIDDVNKAFLKCEEKLKKLKSSDGK